MNFNLAEMPLSLRFRPQTPMSADKLMRFCAANDALRVERDANGDVLSGVVLFVCHSRRESASRTGSHRATVLGKVLEQPRAPKARLIPAWGEAPGIDTPTSQRAESPTHRHVQPRAKMEHWIANGAQLGWLIDPEEKTVHVYRPGDSPEVLHHPTSVQGSGVVAGFELVMARIWE